ncbi:helix-turn-helix domain-containing protein [Myroides sp. LJL115]
MSYKEKIGDVLRITREKKGLSKSNISYMCGFAESTVIAVEKGKASNIDFYVEYAKAVGYPLATLTDLNIPLVPKNPLTEEMLKGMKITGHIRNLVKKGYFSDPLKSGEVLAILLKENLIDKEITSSRVSSLLRNLVEDGTIKAKKKGNINLYFK